uniref:Uncharacterized protein n=1 Tax=Echeneis naucrates TaxID=173247 RepID=A0A665U4N2_ECHNA
MRRWSTLAKNTTVLVRLERGGGLSTVCVCGETTTTTDKDDDDDEGRTAVCARWLRSKRLCSTITATMVDLQGALTHTGPSPSDVMSAARSGFSRLLDLLLDQSDEALYRLDVETLSGRLRLGLDRLTPPQANVKALVSTLQQQFLLFSQRLHSAEVERRSLRLEVASLKKGLERGDTSRTVPVGRFHSVCVELRQALDREQEAQTLIQEQSSQLHTLQQQVNTHTYELTDTQHTLSQTTQVHCYPLEILFLTQERRFRLLQRKVPLMCLG